MFLQEETMSILQLILILFVLSVGVIHLYVMDRSCNDFIDLEIHGDNLSVTDIEEIDGNRTEMNLSDIAIEKRIVGCDKFMDAGT